MGRSRSPPRQRRHEGTSSLRHGDGSRQYTRSPSSPKHGEYSRSRYSPSFGPKEHSPPRPNNKPTGKLAEEHLMRNGVRLKYAEPGDKSKPARQWRMHVFKKDEQISIVPLADKTCYRFGRDPAVLPSNLD